MRCPIARETEGSYLPRQLSEDSEPVYIKGLGERLTTTIVSKSSVIEMPKFVVRYGAMRGIGILSARGNDAFLRGARVIARTERGLEACEVLCEATDSAMSHLESPGHGQILRRMTDEDENELSHMKAQAGDEFQICQKHVDELGLDMELVDLEHVFGGERIVVYYLAEERVDFRELVKRLAVEFQTRIEMRQIGVRDEAKLLADYGDCGKPVCCNTHLSSMPPVSMKMAKLQKATLDPTKISGRCGRLKCCLRYEYDTYVDMQKERLVLLTARRILVTWAGSIQNASNRLQSRAVQTTMGTTFMKSPSMPGRKESGRILYSTRSI